MEKITLCLEDQIDYKVINHGTSAITDSELISMIIGEKQPQLSRKVLNAVENNLYSLGKLCISDLTKLGLTRLKAVTLIAAIELGRRRKLADVPEKNQIRDSRSVVNILQPLIADLQHEEFWVLFLNRPEMGRVN